MLNFLKSLFLFIASIILTLPFSILSFVDRQSASYQPEASQQEDFNYEDTIELTRDEDAYQASLYDVNALRRKCFYGTNQYLSGNITAVVIYVNDFESSWTEEQMDEFTENDVEPALEFLEREAQKYGVELDFETKVMRNAYYGGEVVIDYGEVGYYITDVLDKAAESYDFYSEFELHDWMKQSCGTEILFITVFNKIGSSYGMNPKPWQDQERVEHTVTFSIDYYCQTEYVPGTCATVIANNILHLYGAENLNRPETRKEISKLLYPNDIALRLPYDIAESNIGDATAYYIGWTDEIPEAVYSVGWNDYSEGWNESE